MAKSSAMVVGSLDEVVFVNFHYLLSILSKGILLQFGEIDKMERKI
jgi:hypothetical protein